MANEGTPEQHDTPTASAARADALSHVRTRDDVRLATHDVWHVLDTMQGVYYRTALDGTLLNGSQSGAALLGFTAEELLGRNILELYVTPSDRDLLLLRLHQEGGAVRGYETVLRCKDGSPLNISANVHFWRHADGSIGGIEGTIVDISQQRRIVHELEEKEERLRLALQATGQGTWEYREADGTATVHSGGRLMQDKISGTHAMSPAMWRERIHPEDRPRITAIFEEYRQGSRHEHRAEYRTRADDGDYRWILSLGRAIEFAEDGHATRIIGTWQDISEVKAREESQRLSATVYEHCKEGILVTDARNRIVSVNQSFCRLTGYSPEEVLGRSPCILSSGRHDPAFFARMWHAINDSGHWQGELWNRRKDGSIFPEWLSITCVRDAAGRVSHHVGIFSDISERRAAEERLRYLAHYDPLTELPNLVLFRDRCERALALAARLRVRVGLLYLDIDHFNDINNTLGHQTGDTLLREIARRLADTLRDSDLVGRRGSDEFLICLPHLDDEQPLTAIAGKLLEVMATPFAIDGHELTLTASIGIALSPDDGSDFDELLRNADAAKLAAKRDGRASVRYYTETMNARARQRMALLGDLRHAEGRSELALHYQPLIDLASGRIIGAEALMRWLHPAHGMVPPAEFIPVAEQSGLIVQLGRWALIEGCRQLARWHAAGHRQLMLAVNLSAVQFRRGSIVDDIIHALTLSAANPEHLELELTESVLLQDSDALLGTIDKLKGLGVRLSIDDFGTGYSSLAYLRRLAVDKLKIDQSFVRGILSNEDDATIVGTVAQMGRNLRLQVLAEGIEDAETAMQLRRLGCEYGQGYHFGRPMPDAAFLDLLARGTAPETRPPA